MAVAEGKKRYYLTLTESNMIKFKEMLSSFGAMPGTESILIDEYVSGMVNTMAPALKRIHSLGKNPSMGDFFQLIGLMLNGSGDQLKL
jgi:hypothetical protein